MAAQRRGGGRGPEAPPGALAAAGGLRPSERILRGCLSSLQHAAAGVLLDGHALGALFERGLAESEGLAARLDPSGAPAHAGRRRLQGVYYTPAAVGRSIAARALGALFATELRRLDLPRRPCGGAEAAEGLAACAPGSVALSALHRYASFLDGLRVLDPACGAGSLLCAAADALHRERRAVTEALQICGGEPGARAGGGPPWAAGLWGMDIDADALQVARWALATDDPAAGDVAPPSAAVLRHGDTLLTHPADAARPLPPQGHPRSSEGGWGFDVVLANPPYTVVPAASPARRTPAGLAAGTGLVNSAAIFLSRGLELLRPGGVLGFIVPRSLLSVRSWAAVRRHVLQRCELLVVDDVGRAFAGVGLEQTILIARKLPPGRPGGDGSVRLERHGRVVRVARQAELRRRAVILTGLDPRGYAAVLRMEEAPGRLRDVARMPRGVSLPGGAYRGERGLHGVQVLGGTNVRPCHVGRGNLRKPDRYLDPSHPRLRAAAELFARERLVYQNVMSSVPRLVAAVERARRPTDDTLNNLYVATPGWSCPALGALLMSTPYTFYLRFVLANDAGLTVHLDRPYLGRLPLPDPDAALVGALEAIYERRRCAQAELERLDERLGVSLGERLDGPRLGATRRAWHAMKPAALATTLRRLCPGLGPAQIVAAREALIRHQTGCRALLEAAAAAVARADLLAAAALGLQTEHLESIAAAGGGVERAGHADERSERP